jgi:beta-lactamase regulating signal transducer with metallopeptidase domain/capsule polysaccharide export protein KpsE/RkpR
VNAVFAILDRPLMQQVGWVLLHSLWQGALVGMGFVVLRFALRRCSAHTRYLAGCLCLGLLAAMPVVTLFKRLPSPLAGGTADAVMPARGGFAAPAFGVASGGRSYGGSGPSWPVAGGTDFLARLAPVLASAWVLGVAFFSVKLTGSCWCVRDLRSRDQQPVEAAWMETLDDLRCRLGVSRPVRLLKSALVEVPTVIGWLRPVILLPAATLTGLTPGQLETILAHELAHLRRADYVVNVFQCLVETLMFYHPVVWWISGCIREERENCCDDLVIRVCGDRLGYARALATLEGLRAELPEWAFAASGGSLLNRIRRLVGLANDQGRVTSREVSGLALLGIGLVLVVLGVRMVLSPTMYQSTARIRVNHGQLDTIGWGDSRTDHPFDPWFIQTEFEVIKSEVVLGKVIHELDLNDEWGKKYAGGQRLETYETMGLLRSRLELRPVRSTTLLEIRVSSDKPEEAARIANAIAEAYKGLRYQQFTQSRQEGLKALEDRFKEQEEKVKMAQQTLDKLRVELNINEVSASAESPAPLMTADTLRKLEALRIETKADYVRQAALLAQLRKLGVDLGPQGLAQAFSTAAPDAVLNGLLEQLGLAEQRLVALTQDFGPQHAEVIKSKALVEDLHNKINSRVEGILLGLTAKVLSLSNSLDNLDKEVALAITNDVVRANESRPYFEAKRNLDELQRLRQVLDMKVASEKVDLGLPKTATVEIVDRAAPAVRPVSPNLPRALALMALGVLLDIAGLLMLTGRLGAGSEPRLASLTP